MIFIYCTECGRNVQLFVIVERTLTSKKFLIPFIQQSSVPKPRLNLFTVATLLLAFCYGFDLIFVLNLEVATCGRKRRRSHDSL